MNIHLDSLTYLYIVFGLSVAILIIALAIHVFGVVRLQFREAQVKDSLQSLRYSMRTWGITMSIVMLSGIISLTARFFISGEAARWMITTMVLIFCIGMLSSSLLWFRMLREKFSDENKELHDKIAVLEAQIVKGTRDKR